MCVYRGRRARGPLCIIMCFFINSFMLLIASSTDVGHLKAVTTLVLNVLKESILFHKFQDRLQLDVSFLLLIDIKERKKKKEERKTTWY